MTSENIEHFIAVILFNRYRRIQTWMYSDEQQQQQKTLNSCCQK